MIQHERAVNFDFHTCRARAGRVRALHSFGVAAAGAEINQ